MNQAVPPGLCCLLQIYSVALPMASHTTVHAMSEVLKCIDQCFPCWLFGHPHFQDVDNVVLAFQSSGLIIWLL